MSRTNNGKDVLNLYIDTVRRRSESMCPRAVGVYLGGAEPSGVYGDYAPSVAGGLQAQMFDKVVEAAEDFGVELDVQVCPFFSHVRCRDHGIAVGDGSRERENVP